MLLAIDYDNTYTADKPGMQAIIRCFQTNGHKVILATMRSRELDYHPDFDFLEFTYNVPCYFSDGRSKRDYLSELGIYPNWWLDDNPESITIGSHLSEEELATWREKQKEAV